ncbi:MAG: DVUA0089 family protein [Aggregatilineales bacterium]
MIIIPHIRQLSIALLIIVFWSFPAHLQTDAVPTFPITPGNYEGNINDSFPAARYSFDLLAGQTATIDMRATSGNLDPFLFLFDSKGVFLEENDDVETGQRDAQLSVTTDTDTRYIIESTRFQQDAGSGTGTYLLQLTVTGLIDDETIDPLLSLPEFPVEYSVLEFEEFGTGRLDDLTESDYFVLAGQQGDVLRLIITVVDGDLDPLLSILNEDRVVISRVTQQSETELTVYAILPQRGWYLIEAGRNSGVGRYSVYATKLADSVLENGQQLVETFDPDTEVVSYVFNAVIGDRLFATLSTDSLEDNSEAPTPELTVLDINQNEIFRQQAINTGVRARAFIPRSGAYILQARNLTPERRGTFALDFQLLPVDITKLNVQPASYNAAPYKGIINDENALDYYRFTGKTGELVTVTMQAVDNTQLDPYVILADAQLQELTFNDNASGTRNARITQFALPADGDYFILAGRAGLSRGETSGSYDMELTVGQLTLNSGVLSATLTWQGDADLNLFVQSPSGRIISWSNPVIPEGGTLQIDSNTRCETLADQPVEHIYWQNPDLPQGEYIVRVWHQEDCAAPIEVPFSLQVTVNNQTLLDISPETSTASLASDERFEASIRVGSESAALFNPGFISLPSPQERASEGGDTLILYGQSLTETLNSAVYARFYQFRGQAGDTIQVQAETLTGNLDPILVLRDDSDRNLVSNDDVSDISKNACLTYTLPADGRYVIAVTRYGLQDGLTIGDFRLTLLITQEENTACQ